MVLHLAIDQETIAKGDTVCVIGFDTAKNRPTVKRATRDNLATSKTIFGVAKDDAAEGSVFVLVAGEVAENVVTSLGAGNSWIIATDINNATIANQCRLIRIDRPDGSEFIVGTCDEDGNLTVQPRASRDTSNLHVFNVRSYGALGDSATDDSAAITTAMSAIPSSGGTLLFPPSSGSYVIANDITIPATVQVVFEEGAILAPSASVTATIQGRVRCHPDQHVFSGTGSIALGGGAFEHFNVKNWGAVADWDGAAGTDNIMFFEAAIAAAEAANRPIKIIANGHYYLSRTLVLARQIILEGIGANHVTHIPGTMLVFPKNVTGILIPSTLDPGNPTGGNGENSIVRNLTVFCKETDATGDGIRASIVSSVERCYAASFAEDGFHFVGASIDFPIGSNVNGSRLSHCVATENGLHGFHFEGGDANVSLIVSCLAAGNIGWGFVDESLTGNTYLECYGQGNLGEPGGYSIDGRNHDFKVGGNANATTLFGCYSEASVDSVNLPAGAIGGTLGQGLSGDSTGFALSAGGVASCAPFQYQNNHYTTRTRATFGGERNDPDTVLRFDRLIDNVNTNPSWLTYHDGTKLWRFNNGSANFCVFALPTTEAHMRSAGMWFPNGLFLGNGDSEDGKQLHLAAPGPVDFQPDGAARTYEVGDVVWNSEPSLGGPIGQACITSGTQTTLLGIQTADPMNLGDTTVKLNNVDRLAPGQYITIGDRADVYTIMKVTPINSTIDITPGALIGVPDGKAIAFSSAEFAQFGHVEVIDTTIDPANNYEARAGERVVIKTAGTIMRLPATPVDGDTIEVLNMSGGNATADAGANIIYAAAAGSMLPFGDDVKKTFTWIGSTVNKWKAS